MRTAGGASRFQDANPGNLNGELSLPFRLQTSLENVQEFRVESSSYPAAAAGTFGFSNQAVERTVGLGTHRQIQFALRYSF